MNQRCTQMSLYLRLLLTGILVAVPMAALAFAPDSTTKYRIAYSGASASDFQEVFKANDATPAGQIPKAAQHIKTHLSATLSETWVQGAQGPRLVRYALEDLEILITVNDEPAVQYIKQLKQALKAPIVVEFGSSARVEQYFVKKGAKESGHGVWGLILGFRQFTQAASMRAITTVTEADANGSYRMTYLPAPALNVVPSVPFDLIGRQKIEYLPEPFKWLPGEGVSDKVVTPDHDELWVYQGDTLLAMQGAGNLFISVAGKSVAYSEGVFEMERLQVEALSAGDRTRILAKVNGLAKDGEARRMWQPEISDEHMAKMHAQELKGRTLRELVTALLEADKDDTQRRAQRTPLYMAFQASVYLYPEETVRLKKTLAKLDPDSMPFRVIVSAIAQIGNDQCQALLRWLFTKFSKDPEVRVMALSSLSDVLEPTPSSVALMFKQAKGAKHALERHAAELGIGTMALMLRQKAPRRADELNAWLMQELQNATDDERKEDMLRALGNSGAADSISVLQPFLDEQNPRLRRLAVAALRWNPSSRADQILLGALATDPEDDVRKAALEAFQLRPMVVEAKPVHKEVATKDTNEAIRLGALNNLMRMRYRHPDVLEFVKAREKADPHEETREKIAELLDAE